MSIPRDHWMVCKAKRTDGSPCRAPAIKGGRVCRMHGGAARQVKEVAARRLDELVLPSISKLRTLMLRGESHAVQLKAAESILDRAGIVATKEVAVDNQVAITVTYSDVVKEAFQVVRGSGEVIDVSYAEPELPPGNGHQKAPHQEGPEDGNGAD